MDPGKSVTLITANTVKLHNAAKQAGVSVAPAAVAFLSGVLVERQGTVFHLPDSDAVNVFHAVRNARSTTTQLELDEVTELLWRLPWPFGLAKLE